MSPTYNLEKYSDKTGLQITRSTQVELFEFKKKLIENKAIKGLLKTYLTSSAAVSNAIIYKKEKASIGTTLVVLLYTKKISADFLKNLADKVSIEEIEKECIQKFLLDVELTTDTPIISKSQPINKPIETQSVPKNATTKTQPLQFLINTTDEEDDVNLYCDLFHLINRAKKDVVWIKHFKPAIQSKSEEGRMIKEEGSQNINNWVWQLFPLIIAARGGLTTGAKNGPINFTIILYTKHNPKRVGFFSALLGIGANIIIKNIDENPLPEGFVIDYNSEDAKCLLLSTSNNKRTLSEINNKNLNLLVLYITYQIQLLTKDLKENTYVPKYSEINETDYTKGLQQVEVYETEKETELQFGDDVKKFIEEEGAENITCANKTIKLYKKKQLSLIKLMYDRDKIKNNKFIAVELIVNGNIINSIVVLPTIEKDETGVFSLVDGHTRVDRAFSSTDKIPYVLVNNPTQPVKFSSTLSDLLSKPNNEKYVENGSRDHNPKQVFRNLDSKIHTLLWREFDSVWDGICKDIDFFIEQ